MKPPASGNHGAGGCSAPLDGLALASLSPDQHTSAISSSRCATSGATSMTTTAQRSPRSSPAVQRRRSRTHRCANVFGWWGARPEPSVGPNRANRSCSRTDTWNPRPIARGPRFDCDRDVTEQAVLLARSVATMLPRLGSTRGDSRRLEGTTAWLERDDRQRLSARSPLPSLT